MLDLTFERHRGVEVIPLRDMAISKNITVPQSDIFDRLTGQRGRKFDLQMLIRATASDKSRKDSAVGKRAPLQSPSHPHQVLDMHIRSQRIPAWLGDFAPNISGWRLYSFCATVDK